MTLDCLEMSLIEHDQFSVKKHWVYNGNASIALNKLGNECITFLMHLLTPV